ncbi:hypothetical protein ACYZTX_04435 [Pseudomonas sp. MDT1-17]
MTIRQNALLPSIMQINIENQTRTTGYPASINNEDRYLSVAQILPGNQGKYLAFFSNKTKPIWQSGRFTRETLNRVNGHIKCEEIQLISMQQNL